MPANKGKNIFSEIGKFFKENDASTVATQAGFANDQSFFRAFKQITGMTPSEWRK